MRPKTSELWARTKEAGVAIELLLIKRFYSELSRAVTEELDETPPEPVLLRMRQRFQKVLDKWPEQGLSDMLTIAAGIAPHLPRRVVERLEWGPAALALLNLTDSFAAHVREEGTEVGRLLVRIETRRAHLDVRFPESGEDDKGDGA